MNADLIRSKVMRARRCPVQDEVVEDDQCVVMVQDTVLLLSPLATRILSLTGEGADVSAMASTLEREFGPPGDDHQTLAVTLEALRQLAEQHLVVLWQSVQHAESESLATPTGTWPDCEVSSPPE